VRGLNASLTVNINDYVNTNGDDCESELIQSLTVTDCIHYNHECSVMQRIDLSLTLHTFN